MKLYANITNENGKIKGMGGDERLSIALTVGNQHVATILLDALPLEATRNEKPVTIMQVWDVKNRKQLCERFIIR